MQEIMTDHQFDGLIKMAIKIIEASKDKASSLEYQTGGLAAARSCLRDGFLPSLMNKFSEVEANGNQNGRG